jgi:pyruvate dehydrogenase E1 component alpha subunit
MGTALGRSESQTDLALKASAYQIPSWPVDGMDVFAVADAAHRASLEVRAGHGPVFLELQTYRFRAHSLYDPDRYRTKEEIEHWRERDPIELCTERLRAGGALSDEALEALEEQVAAEVAAAVSAAEAGTEEPVEDLTRFVYSERSP